LGEEKIVGKPVLRKEGVAKVRGRAQYVDDLTLPGMLHGATVRSSIARGRILGIEFGAGIPWEEFVIVTDQPRLAVPGRRGRESSGRGDSAAGASGSTFATESRGGSARDV
jgi:CO/xanthine dehydrogenase Mo-binding subunit